MIRLQRSSKRVNSKTLLVLSFRSLRKLESALSILPLYILPYSTSTVLIYYGNCFSSATFPIFASVACALFETTSLYLL
jgi:hypothetical protein